MSEPSTLGTLEEIKARIEAAVPAAAGKVSVEAPALVIERDALVEVCRFLKTDDALRLNFLSNLCAVDWLKPAPRLEVVYHLFSVEKRHGPLTLKCRTGDRGEDVHVPSVTPVWRSAEYQEREAFDLYGVIFDGHPDLRRILMWDGFEDHPMRKDYAPPDDYEWEPTAHDHVLDKARDHHKVSS